MRKVAIRGLLARRARLALTALAVALGVTLIAGTYVFTDTITRSFDRIFAAAYEGVDVVVTPDDELETFDGIAPPLDAALLDRLRGVPGVAEVEGSLFDPSGVILGKDGKPLQGSDGPNFIGSVGEVERFRSFEFAEGRAPASPDEVALDKATADREGYALGDRVGLQALESRKAYRLVGLTQLEGVESFGGASAALLTLPEAQRLTGKPGAVDQISLAAASGTSAEELRRDVEAVLGGQATVRTGEQETASEQADLRDDLGFLTTALLAFAGISLFVGAFIIFNTFSITVAQRAREFALLRTLGASRAQVLRSVLTEGLVLGVLGSVVGLALGVAVAAGLKGLFGLLGVELPSDGSVVLARTVVVSLLVGVLVTLAASLAPALRATRVPPVAALREGVALPETRSSRLAFPLAVLLSAVGVGLMAIGLFASAEEGTALSLLGGGAAATFLGVALMSPRLVGPLAGIVGRPLRAAGITGRLARENTVRQPGRTAVTAAALMIGVALVVFASIFAAGASNTIAAAVDRGLAGEAILQNQDGFSPFSERALREVAAVPGVADVAAVRYSNARVAGAAEPDVTVTGVDPGAFPRVYNIDIADGGDDALTGLGDGEVLLRDSYAEEQDLGVGDTLRIRTPARRTVTLEVRGVLEDEADLTSALVVANGVLVREFGRPQVSSALVGYEDGADADATKAGIDRALGDRYPQVEALTAEEYKSSVADQINQVLGLIYALLALAIIVSFFGIVNTLVLSITERTRELGLLRAVGMSRRQLRRVVRYEAVITTLIGGVLGLVLGVALAVLVSRPLEDFEISIPVGTLVVVLIASGLVGVVAAVLPARRAARLDVLAALAYE